MKAFVGMSVVYKGGTASNGSNSHAAIVTRSWNTTDIARGQLTNTGLVNLATFPDAGHHVVPLTSVYLFASEADGDAKTLLHTPAGGTPHPSFAYVAGCGIADGFIGAKAARSGSVEEFGSIGAADVGDLGAVLGIAG